MKHYEDTIYILGSGSIGFPLAAYLTEAGKKVLAVRTSRDDISKSQTQISLINESSKRKVTVETISLSNLNSLNGVIVVALKSFANKSIAQELKAKSAIGPVVIMQNGVGVEKPFLDAGLSPVYRCVLYITSQPTAENEFAIRPVNASPIGIVNGNKTELKNIVNQLTTADFPFRTEADIEKEVWKKAIINVVFNSVCPLLITDNGIFMRDKIVHKIAVKLVRECLLLTKRLKISLSENEIMEQILKISKSSDGKLISTLQDIRNGRQTEIQSLNHEMVQIAASLEPKLNLPTVETLGDMIIAKASLSIQG